MTTDIDLQPRTEVATHKLLTIETPHPSALYAAMLNQIGTKSMVTLLSGEQVGSVEITDPDSPIHNIKTNVRGCRVSERFEEIPDKPGSFRGVGESITEFGLETEFRLKDHTYLDNVETKSMMDDLRTSGYEVTLELLSNGARNLSISNSKAKFEMFIGWPDESSLLEEKRKRVEDYKVNYPTLISMAEEDVKKVLEKKDKSYIRLDVENEHPGRGPAGRKVESEEQVLEYIEEARKLTELTASLLMRQLSPNMKLPEMRMVWTSDKVVPVIWDSAEPPKSIEDLNRLSLNEINESLVRAVQGLQKEQVTPDLISKEGINVRAGKVLSLIEEYFKDRKVGLDGIENLNERDQAYLALGLALKSLEKAVVSEKGDMFTPMPFPEIGGVTFKVYGESQRSRFEFFMQQDRKFSYKRENSEAAKFFLLHTKLFDQQDELTRYERIQSRNLEDARKFVIEELELKKLGKYSTADVKEINSRLLKDIVPERNLGQLRASENTKVGERIGATEPKFIESNLTRLLDSACNFVNGKAVGDIKVTEDETIRRLAREWASFDGIHPMEEGNGRTGTLLFESWLRLSLGRRKKFTSERKETWKLAGAMTEALSGEGHEFWYTDDDRFIKDQSLDRLVDYIKSHTTEDWSQV